MCLAVVTKAFPSLFPSVCLVSGTGSFRTLSSPQGNTTDPTPPPQINNSRHPPVNTEKHYSQPPAEFPSLPPASVPSISD